MRISSLVVLGLVVASFAALPARADCTVVSPAGYPDINYTTVCLVENHVYGDGTQEFDNDYVAHVSHAVEADPAFDYSYVRVDQGLWTYDDGEVAHSREWTHIGSGAFMGVRGVVGWGYHANLNQRDQSAGEDAGDACSSFVGQSTCLGAGGWFTIQDVGGVGVGLYYQQTGSGDACEQRASAGATLGIVYVPIDGESAPCAAEVPMLYEAVPFRDLPIMP